MILFSSKINFMMISKALSGTIETLESDGQPSNLAVQKLKRAQEELQQALSFSLADRFSNN